MDHISAGDATRDGARTRRRHMRDKARAQRGGPSPASDRYQTPEWLERSFVLPLTHPEARDVPSQSVGRHDDAAYLAAGPRVIDHDTRAVHSQGVRGPAFVRPPSDDVDFARMIRRADLCRSVARVSSASAGLAGLALIVYLLLTSVAALAVVIVCTVACLASMATLVGLTHAPIARLQR